MDAHSFDELKCPGCSQTISKLDPDAIVIRVVYEDDEHICESVSLYHDKCAKDMGDAKVKERGEKLIQSAIAMAHFTSTAPAHHPETLN